MAKKLRELDTPFRTGERVVVTTDLLDVKQGTKGKVRLANGLGNWRRYWVRFENGEIRGQVSHQSLTRPDQMDAWLAREEDKAAAALRTAEESASAEVDSGDSGGDAGGGIASLIPAALLERSKAAKARLLG